MTSQTAYRDPAWDTRLASLDDDQPYLIVIVDTEEEFDWTDFARENRSVTSAVEQDDAQEIFSSFGVMPTYVVDYCIVENETSATYFRNLLVGNKCEIGAHLHPWVTPPYEEDLNLFNSYHGNLPRDLEQAKLQTLTRTIESVFGMRPDVFKAGRYGLGPNTYPLLQKEGYKIDCSVMPHTSYRADHGPSFMGWPDKPFWINENRDFLEIPLTKGFSGALARAGHRAAPYMDQIYLTRLRIPGIFSKLNVLERAALSPEGFTTAEQIRLLQSLFDRGHRVFSLTYHSSSLGIGHTQYVRSKQDRDKFLRRIRNVLTFFRDKLGGRFTTPKELYNLMSKNTSES